MFFIYLSCNIGHEIIQQLVQKEADDEERRKSVKERTESKRKEVERKREEDD